MTREEMLALKPGDLIRHKSYSDACIVHQIDRDVGVHAIRLFHATNPPEWDKVDAGGRVISS